MTPLFLLRLVLDFVAAGLLLVAMAYSWLGNAAHEIVGTAMFLLLVSHNVFNRRWYGTIARRRSDVRGVITRAINLSLLTFMLALLVTSVIVSQTVFTFLPLTSTFTVRQIHTLAAYLVLLVAGAHLGLHWSIIMTAARRTFGITNDSKPRSLILTGLAILVAACGALSLPAIDLPSKLLMQPVMDFGDFRTPASIVLMRHAAVVGLLACIAHYGLKVVGRRQRVSDRQV